MTKLDPCRDEASPRKNRSNSQKSFTLRSAKSFENLEEFTRRKTVLCRRIMNSGSAFIEQMLDDSS